MIFTACSGIDWKPAQASPVVGRHPSRQGDQQVCSTGILPFLIVPSGAREDHAKGHHSGVSPQFRAGGQLIGAGLASTTGSTLAHEDGGKDGFANVVSVHRRAGAVQDVSGALDLGLLGDDEDGDGAAAQPESQSCGTGTDAAA